MDAAVLTERVRDRVRAAGIDPLADPAEVQRLVDGAVAEAVADSASPVTTEHADAAARLAHAAVAGYGPLQPLFDDPTVEEIWLNDPARVFVARDGRHELTPIVLDALAVRELVERMLRQSGRRLDISTPFVDARLPDGSRLHVAIPPVTRAHWAVNIRRFLARDATLDDLVRRDSLSPAAADFLDAAVGAGLSVLVCGATHAGKTTLVNALLTCVRSGERIVTCEEVFELTVAHADRVAMQTRSASLEGTGEITLRDLVREALRMRPTRLVVGEVRLGEALDLLIAMNSGVPAMATIHANSAQQAITKMCTLPLLAGPNIGAAFVVPTVAGCVDVVVHLALEDGRRRVRSIHAVTGEVDDRGVVLAEVFRRDGSHLVRSAQAWPTSGRWSAIACEDSAR